MAHPRHRLARRGFTLIELMIVVAIIGILAAVAIPQFLDYIKRSKSGEAQLNLAALEKSNLRGYHENSGYVIATAADTPVVDCCTQNVNGQKKCQVLDSDWSQPAWEQLDFEMYKAFYFQYAYNGVSSTNYTATATGDVDCDGTVAIWTLVGTTSSGSPTAVLNRPPNRD